MAHLNILGGIGSTESCVFCIVLPAKSAESLEFRCPREPKPNIASTHTYLHHAWLKVLGPVLR